MGTRTGIEWCDHTWNPWRGCTHVSAGCDHCYAERGSKIHPQVLGQWGPAAPRIVAANPYWGLPSQWNAEAKRAGVRRRVFLGSLMDFFEDFEGPLERGGRRLWVSDQRPDRYVPMPGNERDLLPIERQNIAAGVFRQLTLVDLRERIWRIMASTPHLDWLLLTKRPENFQRCLPWIALGPWSPWRHVWLGVSVENQAAANRRIPALLAATAAMRFLSCEPLLGPVVLSRWLHSFVISRNDSRLDLGSASGGSPIDWVIVGGESGPDARPMHPHWVRSIRDQCATSGVPFMFKQWGEWAPMPCCDPHIRFSEVQLVACRDECGYYCDPAVGHVDHGETRMCRVGRNAAGRFLDGREWNEYPEVKRR